MTPPVALASDEPQEIVYPESDGLPMADNSVQFEWIYIIYGNLAALFADLVDVFVCGNQFWYPREGDPSEVQAPDIYVVFGRPKGDRPSYKQWEEDGVPMTVVFEIMSPSNDPLEMARKLAFYDEYGVEEYYIFDPLENMLQVYHRGRQALCSLSPQAVYTSPRLGILFDLTGEEMVVYYPDGRPFLSFEELSAERMKEERLRLEAERAATLAQNAAEQANLRAEQAQRDAEQAQRAILQANTRAELAQRDAEQANTRAERARRDAEQANTRVEKAQRDAEQTITMMQRLRELSRKARLQQATPEELAELDRLEASDASHP